MHARSLRGRELEVLLFLNHFIELIEDQVKVPLSAVDWFPWSRVKYSDANIIFEAHAAVIKQEFRGKFIMIDIGTFRQKYKCTQN